MSDDARYEAGLEVIVRMFGGDLVGSSSSSLDDPIAASVGRLAVEQCYGDIWTRDGLSAEQRSLVTIGVLVAQRQADELTNHVVGGLGNGLTPDEIREAVLQTLPYVGFPALSTALRAMTRGFRAAGTGAAEAEAGLETS